MSTQSIPAAGTDYTVTAIGSLKIGASTYAIERQTFHATGGEMIWLRGPRGGEFFLRPIVTRSRGRIVQTGLFQAISFGSGAALRVKGNEVRLFAVGGIFEIAR